MTPRIVRVPFLIPGWAAAQVLLPRTVFVVRGAVLTERLLAHELMHLEQIERLGLARYWTRYLLGLVRNGYRRHPMELEARRAEANPSYRARARRILQGVPEV